MTKREPIPNSRIRFSRAKKSVVRAKSVAELIPLQPTMYYLLSSIMQSPKHGYAVIKEVEEITEGLVKLSVPSVYENLHRMLNLGLVEPVQPDSGTDTSKIRYKITRFGSLVLMEEEYARSAVSRRNMRVFWLAKIHSMPADSSEEKLEQALNP